MKSILKTYRSEWLVNVLNGNASILIAKNFPKDYVGWVYIYCTNSRHSGVLYDEMTKKYEPYMGTDMLNGKIVARFWCDKVMKISTVLFHPECYMLTENENEENLPYDHWKLKGNICLTEEEVNQYLQGKDGCAIHISKLEVFDRPLYLDDFTRPAKCKHCKECEHTNNKICDKGFVKMFDKAPANYCYIEGED